MARRRGRQRCGPNGTDNLAPEALADCLAQELDALIAPTIPYAVNTAVDEYAGTFAISAEVLRELARQVFSGLAATGLANIIVLKGTDPTSHRRTMRRSTSFVKPTHVSW